MEHGVPGLAAAVEQADAVRIEPVLGSSGDLFLPSRSWAAFAALPRNSTRLDQFATVGDDWFTFGCETRPRTGFVDGR